MNKTQKYDLKEYVTINTDASYDHNGNGGYGIWIKSNFFTIKKEGKFNTPITDSNEAEIKALVNALYILSKNDQKFKVAVINCDNAVVRQIVNQHKIPNRFKKEGEQLLTYLQDYKISYAKVIKGHLSKTKWKSRNFVNNWCDKHSRTYKNKNN